MSCGGTRSSRGYADPRIQATELLLQERVPREAILSEPRPAEAETAPDAARLCVPELPHPAHPQRAHPFPEAARYDRPHERRRYR